MNAKQKYYLHVAERNCRELATSLDALILATPTSDVRDRLTEANIHLTEITERIQYVRSKLS